MRSLTVLVYIICACVRRVVSNTYCVVFFFVLCTLCCQFLYGLSIFDCPFGILYGLSIFDCPFGILYGLSIFDYPFGILYGLSIFDWTFFFYIGEGRQWWKLCFSALVNNLLFYVYIIFCFRKTLIVHDSN